MSFPRFPRGATVITPSDSTDLGYTSIFAVGAGDLVVQSASNPETITIPVTDSLVVPFEVRRVMAATTVPLVIGIG